MKSFHSSCLSVGGKRFHIPQVKCYELTFEGSQRRQGLCTSSFQSEEKVPIIFHFHGYMGRGWDWADMLAYTVAGYGVVSMDVRDQSVIAKMACALLLEIPLKGTYHPWCC